MTIGSLIIGGGTVLVAAEIATWCFKSAAESERQYRRDFVRSERAERREIERETRRRLAQEAYEQRGAWLDMLTGCMSNVWEMRTRTRELRAQFQDIVRANELLIRTSPLTFQQQEAIRECIFHLERGIARLQAYSGPYLQAFVSDIKNAKRAALGDTFIEPEMPDPVLPDDFPVVGDNLRLSRRETQTLLRTGSLELGSGQVGRLSRIPPSVGSADGVDAFVEEYDRDSFCWRLSLAKGAVASASASHAAGDIEAMLLSQSKGGFRAAWHSPFAESVELFMPFALADAAMRAAPFGTRLSVFVHQTDYRTRRIVVGQRRPSPPDDLGNSVLLEAGSPDVRNVVERALSVSPSTFWLIEGPVNLGGTDAGLRVRVATGEEFAVTADDARGVLRIGEQTGYRLGNVDGAICRSYVGLRFADHTGAAPEPGRLKADEFLARIRRRLDEQEELQRVFREESLETRKYQLLLEAKMEASKSSSRVAARYSAYRPARDGGDDNGQRHVAFVLEAAPATDLKNYAVEVLPESHNSTPQTRLCGFARSVDRVQGTLSCSFSDDLLRLFLDRQVDARGTLECTRVDIDAQRQVRALDQFRNVTFLQGKSAEDREAFRNLRRILLGLSRPNGDTGGAPAVENDVDLNPEQQRALQLINSNCPLTLLLGPPGTGKTDTIAIALEAFLRRCPGARVSLVSQANVAVNEALSKLKTRFPECDVLWEVSEEAKKKFVTETNEHLIQDARCDEFLRKLAVHHNLPEWAATIRDHFRSLCEDKRFVQRRILKAFTQSSSVYGCTLSILGRLSLGAPLFDIVVVDEAAKASLPECMIAALSAKRLVLVGDHNQLLPFLDERILERAGPLRADQQVVHELWNNSLFQRMWNQAPEQVKVLLTTQYRSRSGIREAVSALFYDGRLKPGRTDGSEKVPFPCSLVWVDTKGRRQDQARVRNSLVNEREVDITLATLEMLAQSLPNPSATSVAIICFYGEQRALIERVLRESPVTQAFSICEARTVDASQGGQWDVVLLSLTRCDGSTSFVGNANRLNVALSRARELAVVIGSLPFALRDRNPESKLGALGSYVQARKGQCVWICAPGPRGGIAPGFGFRTIPEGRDV